KQLQNKAQASFFAIIGVLLFIAAIIGFFVYNNIKKTNIEQETKKAAEISLQAEEVKKFVNDCIRKSTFEGLKTLGQTGGYLEVPKLINFKGISYWQIDQANIQPFLNQTQKSLLEYINLNLPRCVESGNISSLGFSIEKKEPAAFIEFGNSDVTIKVIYPIKLSKEGLSKEFSEFFNTFDIRYRATFEAAKEVNERIFEPDFEIKNPLKKMDYIKSLDFDIGYKTPETDIMVFTVTDKKSVTPTNEFYTFSFAAKLGKSELKKITSLQNRSATNPVFLQYTVFSVDKKAQLDISSGTTINLNGQDVPAITVQQSYPQQVVAKNVPVEKENKEIKRREDLNYRIDNPVYSFEPDDLLFNKPQLLTLYYDDPQGKDAKGVGILKGKNNFWVPIPSFEDRANRKVFANIIGFTQFTAVFCEGQNLKKAIARQVFEANAGCYVSLVIMVIMIVVAFYLVGPAFVSGGLISTNAAALGGAEALTAAAAATAPTTAGGLGLVQGYIATLGANLASAVGTGAVTVGTATAIGLAVTALSSGISLVGAATEAFYTSSPENCQGFVPTCTWQVGVNPVEVDGTGRCIPGSGTFQAGVPVTLCAQVKKCNFIQKFTCQKCSVECTASYY
ncbi:hypothetical protein HYX03_02490, partial [Candidatus Woesearchaeota archaeon]|nr:hypothetical protein [Candidatus Woesearchaeota archaeon]